MRIGIGRPEHKSDVVQYVLSDFTVTEETELDSVVLKCTKMLYDGELFPKKQEEEVKDDDEHEEN